MLGPLKIDAFLQPGSGGGSGLSSARGSALDRSKTGSYARTTEFPIWLPAATTLGMG